MPTETPEEKSVQVPAQHQKRSEREPFVRPMFSQKVDPPKPPKAAAVSEPGVDYDKFRGQGGDYEINEEGHRVPLKK